MQGIIRKQQNHQVSHESINRSKRDVHQAYVVAPRRLMNQTQERALKENGCPIVCDFTGTSSRKDSKENMRTAATYWPSSADSVRADETKDNL